MRQYAMTSFLPSITFAPLYNCTSSSYGLKVPSAATAWLHGTFFAPGMWPARCAVSGIPGGAMISPTNSGLRSEEHTSELQSQSNLVCRLLLEKKKKTDTPPLSHHS